MAFGLEVDWQLVSGHPGWYREGVPRRPLLRLGVIDRRPSYRGSGRLRTANGDDDGEEMLGGGLRKGEALIVGVVDRRPCGKGWWLGIAGELISETPGVARIVREWVGVAMVGYRLSSIIDSGAWKAVRGVWDGEEAEAHLEPQQKRSATFPAEFRSAGSWG
ncbi:hypothetical protein FA13DRAFT_1716208 [Coprinellus micaceus]|uniref:Uncharacterized protein n=1 Tax=Coprinellus micaceus TaxID=71717 RepID=A0A4Y7SL04_COPMI|nr:hypothetical protein FA13DRAFT_1716208 [Coprinellus micaceus]